MTSEEEGLIEQAGAEVVLSSEVLDWTEPKKKIYGWLRHWPKPSRISGRQI